MTKNELRKEIEKQVNKYSIHCEKNIVTVDDLEQSRKDIENGLNDACKIANIRNIEIFSIGEINTKYKIFEIKHIINVYYNSNVVMGCEFTIYDAKLEGTYKILN